MQKIIEKIRKERKRQEITQSELSKRTGVSIVTISNMERGKPISASTLEKICIALGLELHVVENQS